MHVGHDYNLHLFLLLCLVDVVLDAAQHIQTDWVAGIVDQYKGIRVEKVVFRELLQRTRKIISIVGWVDNNWFQLTCPFP